MKRMIVLGAFLLAGCSYVPPPTTGPDAGPVATLNLNIKSNYDAAQFSIEPTAPGPINDGVALQTGLSGGGAQTDTIVRAGNVYLTYIEGFYGGSCEVRFGFLTLAGQTYNVYGSDTPPPPVPPGSFVHKLLHNGIAQTFPGCTVHVTQTSGGGETPVKIWGWHRK